MNESPSALPEDLELIAPGPELAALLDSVDRKALSGGDRLRLAQARNRLASYTQARLLEDLYAVSLEEPPRDQPVQPQQASRYQWAEAEVAFALRWTRTAAGGRLEQARELVEDLPAVLHALLAGDIDMPKALVITELAGWLPLADLALRRELVDRVIDQASRWTTGELRARLRKLILAIDPDAAAKRYVKAVKARRVEIYDNPDCTGELWGRNLPPQDTAAAWERLTAIARAAKATGDTRPMDQLRADAFLDLLVGQGVAIGQPLTHHTTGAVETPTPLANASAGGTTPPNDVAGTTVIPPTPSRTPRAAVAAAESGSAPDRVVAAPEPGGAAGAGPVVAVAGSGSAPDRVVAAPEPGGGAGPVVAMAGSSSTPDPAVTAVTAPAPSSTPDPAVTAPAPSSTPDPAVTASETTSTLPEAWDPQWPTEPWEPIRPHHLYPYPTGAPDAGLDTSPYGPDGERAWPADWPGRWLPDPAVTAAANAGAAAGARAGGTGGGGDMAGPPSCGEPCCQTVPQLGDAVTGPPAAPMPRPRRGIIELQVPLTTALGLDDLPGELNGYGPVLGEIARQIITAMPDAQWRYSAYSRLPELALHGILTNRPTPTLDQDGTRRRPTAEQTAHVKTRDRTCRAPGCRRPARTCDLDHTEPWVKGGLTVTCNLGALCRAHHLFRHTTGCELTQLSPGVFIWQTPRGLQYLTKQDPPMLAVPA